MTVIKLITSWPSEQNKINNNNNKLNLKYNIKLCTSKKTETEGKKWLHKNEAANL